MNTRLGLSLVLFASLVIACVSPARYTADIDNSGHLVSGLGNLRSSDLVYFLNSSTEFTRPVRLEALGLVDGWICFRESSPLGRKVARIWISGLIDQTLPGVLVGLPKEVELSIDDATDLTFDAHDIDLTPWLEAQAHLEPKDGERRYRVQLEGNWTSATMTWPQTVALLSKPSNLLGWPQNEIVETVLERMELDTGRLVVGVLMGGAGGKQDCR